MATREQLDDFHRFALDQLDNGGTELSMDEVYDMWRRENPDTVMYDDDVAAIRAAIDDYKRGDRGRPAGELTGQLREQIDRPANK